MISLGLKCADLCKPDSGAWNGAPDHAGKAHIATYSQLVHGLHLKQPTVVHTVCCIDGFEVPALQQTYCLLYYSDYKFHLNVLLCGKYVDWQSYSYRVCKIRA